MTWERFRNPRIWGHRAYFSRMQKDRAKAVGFGVAAALFLAGMSAWACSCKLPPPPTEAYEKAQAVFTGTVTRLGQDDTLYEEQTAYPGQRKYIRKENQLTAWVNVTKAWKGVSAATVKVNTAENDAVCGYPFVTGKDYLFYAAAYAHGEFHVSLCSRTRLLEAAGEDLQALKDYGNSAENPGGT